MASLSSRKLRFVEEYLTHFDARRAAREAGYSEKSATRLLQTDDVRQALRRATGIVQDHKAGKACGKTDESGPAQQETVHQVGCIEISRDTVKAGLLREAMSNEPGSGPGNRLKAWELLGKLMGYFGDKPEQETPVRVLFDLDIERKQ